MAITLDPARGLPPDVTTTASSSTVSAGADFSKSLHRVLEAVDASAGDANVAVRKMLDGTGDIHEAMIAIQRADATFQLTVQVRNKLLQAYQDIMRMPI